MVGDVGVAMARFEERSAHAVELAHQADLIQQAPWQVSDNMDSVWTRVWFRT